MTAGRPQCRRRTQCRPTQQHCSVRSWLARRGARRPRDRPPEPLRARRRRQRGRRPETRRWIALAHRALRPPARTRPRQHATTRTKTRFVKHASRWLSPLPRRRSSRRNLCTTTDDRGAARTDVDRGWSRGGGATTTPNTPAGAAVHAMARARGHRHCAVALARHRAHSRYAPTSTASRAERGCIARRCAQCTVSPQHWPPPHPHYVERVRRAVSICACRPAGPCALWAVVEVCHSKMHGGAQRSMLYIQLPFQAHAAADTRTVPSAGPRQRARVSFHFPGDGYGSSYQP